MSESNKYKFLIIVIGIALVFFAIGFYWGKVFTINYFKPQLEEAQQRLKEWQQRWEQAKEYFGVAEGKMYSLSGKVTEVKGKIILAEVGPSPDPFILDWPREREIVVTENTTIILGKRKDPEKLEKEWKEHKKREEELFEIIAQEPKREKELAYPEPPSQFEEIKKISINQVEEGMKIIYAKTDRDITTEKRFEAIKILVAEITER